MLEAAEQSSPSILILPYVDPRIPPRAVAGPNITIRLPETTAILDGSQSHDNFGIVSYHWERSSNSPAAGVRERCHHDVIVGSCDVIVMMS